MVSPIIGGDSKSSTNQKQDPGSISRINPKSDDAPSPGANDDQELFSPYGSPLPPPDDAPFSPMEDFREEMRKKKKEEKRKLKEEKKRKKKEEWERMMKELEESRKLLSKMKEEKEEEMKKKQDDEELKKEMKKQDDDDGMKNEQDEERRKKKEDEERKNINEDEMKRKEEEHCQNPRTAFGMKGRKGSKAHFASDSPPESPPTRSPVGGKRSQWGRKTPPVTIIESSSSNEDIPENESSSSPSSSSSSSQESRVSTSSDDESSSSTTVEEIKKDDEELSEKMKDVKITNSIEELQKENAKMKVQLQLIQEKLDAIHAQACFDNDKELLHSNKDMKKQVKKMKDPKEVQELAQELIPDNPENKIIETLPGKYPSIILKILTSVCKIRRLERQLEAFESCRKLSKTHASTSEQEMQVFYDFYNQEIRRLDEEMDNFKAHYYNTIKSWYKKTNQFKESNPTFLEDLFLIGSRNKRTEKQKIQDFLNTMFPSIYGCTNFNQQLRSWIEEAKNKYEAGPKNNEKIWSYKKWKPISINDAEKKLDEYEEERRKDIQHEQAKRKEKKLKRKKFNKDVQKWKRMKNEAYKKHEHEFEESDDDIKFPIITRKFSNNDKYSKLPNP